MVKKEDNVKLDYYQQNTDYKARVMVNNNEKSIFPKDSSLRIWYNELPCDYSSHWHNALEIIAPIENYYDVEIDGDYYHVVPGEIIIIPPRRSHSLHAPKTGCRYVCLFDIDFFSSLRGYSSLITMLQDCIHITPESHAPIFSEISDLFSQIWNEYFQKTEFYEFSIYSHLFQIMTILSRHRLSKINIFTDSTPVKRHEYFEKLNNAIDYIDQNYTYDITLEDVAAYSGFSKFHFSRLFKEYMNCTFYDYLIGQRIKATEVLLTRDDLSITDIALQSGFSSISTFNRTFKQKKGCTPGEYRSLFSQGLHKQQQG
ncbi:AraC-type DNA-binding protein [Butyrivibrio hungatei DSM 14810]|jgi:AraC-like DNA-binding protein|uniref:AraC family transcriptional regulator n=2 Tax=Butyrivibrio hungatei TaxID=185008 RepID=A0A1D9NYC4_9FIRM|nr:MULTISPECIES: AraC family transcriptional regulator [Butyrivibrio]AOZ95204.1 AraC family transcriptional regulator [Butyrivibrio hungatei]MBE5840576.1 AraC family transcriptional regulator [Butyrivibrio sp.]SHN57623.1 AraC-type DNA-binding protein [Butyrivibrio hungatei DSM 14810]